MPIIKQCSQCGKTIKIPPSKNSTHNFCNRNCYLLFHQKPQQTAICEVCHKEFIIENTSNANRFCSRDCYNIFHNITNKFRTCLTCGKAFEARNSKHQYCSTICYNKQRHMPKGPDHWNWQGGKSLINDKRDSQEYKQWRQKVYERDNYQCAKCGSKEKLNAHHIKSWKSHPELRYDVSNGITWCEKCHIAYHQKFGYIEKE